MYNLKILKYNYTVQKQTFGNNNMRSDYKINRHPAKSVNAFC